MREASRSAEYQLATHYEVEDGVIQLRFTDGDGGLVDLNAAELAESIQGLVEFTSQMAKDGMLGDGVPPEVRIRPMRQGSFILEGVIQWMGQNPEATVEAIGLSASGVIAKAVGTGLRLIRGEHPDYEYLPDGMVKVTWANGDVNPPITRAAWESLSGKKRKTRRALAKIMEPMADEARTMEVRSASVGEDTDSLLAAEPSVVAETTDYRIAVSEPDDVETTSITYTEEAKLETVDFREGSRWRIRTASGAMTAIMEDNEFQLELDRGLALHKTDLLEVTIREDTTITNGRKARKYALVAVRIKRRGEAEDDNPA